MPPAPATERPPVRKGQTLTYEDLRREAESAVDADPRPRYEIAAALDVTPGALTKALKFSGPRYWKLQRRALALLRPEYAIREVGGFEVERAE